MKLWADLVEIGDWLWAAFQRVLLFNFAPRLRSCWLLAPHALLVTGWRLAMAADRRLTSGMRSIGGMDTATGIDGDTIAGGSG
jgi:hypothetical protein